MGNAMDGTYETDKTNGTGAAATTATTATTALMALMASTEKMVRMVRMPTPLLFMSPSCASILKHTSGRFPPTAA